MRQITNLNPKFLRTYHWVTRRTLSNLSDPRNAKAKFKSFSRKMWWICIFSLPVLPPQNKPISMTVNAVFSKSSKGLNSILKSLTEKPNTKVTKCRDCTQETKTSNLFERRTNFDACWYDVSNHPSKSLECMYSDKWQI